MAPLFFSGNQVLEVVDSVQVYPSAKAAHDDFATVANAKAPGCLDSLMNGSGGEAAAMLGHGAKFGKIKVRRDSASEYPAHSTGFALSVPVSEQGVKFTVEITEVDYVSGRMRADGHAQVHRHTLPGRARTTRDDRGRRAHLSVHVLCRSRMCSGAHADHAQLL